MEFYCERAAGFSNDVGLQEERCFDALVRMFGQALKTIGAFPEKLRSALLTRLKAACQISHKLGYGVGDDMDTLLASFALDERNATGGSQWGGGV